MHYFFWFILGMGLMGLALLCVEFLWYRFENKQMRPISVKKPKPDSLGIIDTTEKSK